ncbi:hypothetical protein [Geomonas oryzae]|uniref:hypothetical protein n=1 Tax=Geomonas oryzae TaxID=2364273 RepID=UPI00100BDAD7|nr:hypothetical protein [Geomonas oryzae]
MIGRRFDYMLVWGHGVEHMEAIAAMIREHPAFKIVKVLHHVPESVDLLVHAVYSFDYAPIEHLKDKTEYLRATPRESYLVFLENRDPDEDYFGEGSFRHLESRTMKALKERIRDRFNPYRNGKRTDEHVIHASDNQLQTDHILRYLGYPGVELFADRNVVLSAPYHLGEITDYCIRELHISALRCRMVTGERHHPEATVVAVEDTPHYRALCGDGEAYRLYLRTFLGTALTDDHTLEGLLRLAASFDYLAPPFDNAYVIVREEEPGIFAVLDGAHRVAILKHRGVTSLAAAVICNKE